jgi:hypothetical protein
MGANPSNLFKSNWIRALSVALIRALREQYWKVNKVLFQRKIEGNSNSLMESPLT